MTRPARSKQPSIRTKRAPLRKARAIKKILSRGKKLATRVPQVNGSALPLTDWARAHVFDKARVVAWEGTSAPLSATALFPSENPFISNLTATLQGTHIWSDLVHPLDRARVLRYFADLRPDSPAGTIDYRVIDQHGAVVWIRHWVDSVHASEPSSLIRGFVGEIQAEKEFQLESLRVSEREQNRIGQDLHDDLCQVLAGVSCLMRVFEGRVAPKLPEEVEWLKELNQQIVDAMHRTRALTHGLFPGKIQIADIRGALLELASQVKTRFTVEINTQFVGRFPKHSSAQIIQIYRISQEAMSNAIKHGRATRIDVRLEALPGTMELSILDNGCGFTKVDGASSGVGLNIMKYRASTLGGEVSVVDQCPKGVRVTLRYPFESN